MNDKIKNIIRELETLTLLEAAALVKEIEQTFGIDISTITPITEEKGSNKQAVQPEKIEEKTTFDIILNEVPADKRISVLKIVRNITGLGLKESKEIVDTVPKTLKQGITKEEAETIKKELDLVGAITLIN